MNLLYMLCWDLSACQSIVDFFLIICQTELQKNGFLFRKSTYKALRYYLNKNSSLKFDAIIAHINRFVVNSWFLFSSFSRITDDLLAMARPSTEIIEKFDIIDQFLR